MNKIMSSTDVEYIVIHSAATPSDMDVDISDVDRWHREKGYWKVGYHFFVKRDGTYQFGRALFEPGAHCKGYNNKSIGICYAGGADKEGNPEDNKTFQQEITLFDLIKSLQMLFTNAKVVGHGDLPGTDTECPSFNVTEWMKSMDI